MEGESMTEVLQIVDGIRCAWCGLPVGLHPQDEGGTYRCFDARGGPRGKLPNPDAFRWGHDL